MTTRRPPVRAVSRRPARWLTAALLCATPVLVALGGPNSAVADGPGHHFDEIPVSSPTDIVCNQKSAPDGSLWFVEEGSTRLGRLDMETGEVRKFDMPGISMPLVEPVLPYPSTLAIGPCDLAFDHQGRLWFNFQQANVLGYIETQEPYRMRTLALTPGAIPMSLALGQDGNIYATLTGSNQIARVDPRTGGITYYPVPTPASGIIGGAAGHDGAHWFVEMTADKVLRFDYATHQMREYRLPSVGSGPIVIRWIQGALWFTEMTAGRIGRLDPSTGQITEVSLPNPASVPISLTEGADGDIYSDEAAADKIARIDPHTMTVVAEYSIPTQATFPEEITTGPDGAIWFPESLAGNLGRLWVDSFGVDPGPPPAP